MTFFASFDGGVLLSVFSRTGAGGGGGESSSFSIDSSETILGGGELDSSETIFGGVGVVGVFGVFGVFSDAADNDESFRRGEEEGDGSFLVLFFVIRMRRDYGEKMPSEFL